MLHMSSIGFFDSGIGGLTVLRAVQKVIPYYTYKYFGDTKNNPYGERTPKEIYDLTISGITFLLEKGCLFVILACNSASTVLPRIQSEWLPYQNFPGARVLGIIRPTAEHMAESGVNTLSLMATPATVAATSYENELKKLQSNIRIQNIACPGLARAIEKSRGQTSDTILRLVTEYSKHAVNPLYLCCTHYEFCAHQIAISSGVEPVIQSQIVAEKTKDYLVRHPEIVSGLSQDNVTPELYFSASEAENVAFAHEYLQE